MPVSPAARPDAIRRFNLSLMLGEIHRDGALTRAELTQRLGLSRSTIGALVADLAELGLVAESVPTGGVRAGRPSHLVGPNRAGPYVVAVDVDVTHLTAAAVGIGGELLARHVVRWPDDPPTPAVAAHAIADSVRVLQRGTGRRNQLVGVGVSVPGTVERHTGRVGVAPNLGWRSVPFRDLVDTRIASRVAVGNDADLAVLAEHRRGSARGCDDVAYLIGRVGVGAGIIVNGVPLRGAAGHAGEIGHNVMDLAGPECHCGNRGCVETFVGDIALLGLAGRVGPPTEEQVRSVFEDARSGKKTELQAVRTVAGALGRTIAEVVNTVDPKRVICGGSLSEILDIAGDEVRRSFERFVFTGGADVELVQPAFAADGAMLGAAEIAFEALLADPLSAAG